MFGNRVLFDGALGHRPELIWFAAAAVIILAALYFIWHTRSSSYTPYLATEGYRAFLKVNEKRLTEKSKALVSGVPILRFYARQSGPLRLYEKPQANAP